MLTTSPDDPEIAVLFGNEGERVDPGFWSATVLECIPGLSIPFFCLVALALVGVWQKWRG